MGTIIVATTTTMDTVATTITMATVIAITIVDMIILIYQVVVILLTLAIIVVTMFNLIISTIVCTILKGDLTRTSRLLIGRWTIDCGTLKEAWMPVLAVTVTGVSG